jgi:hypothetical protein
MYLSKYKGKNAKLDPQMIRKSPAIWAKFSPNGPYAVIYFFPYT